MESIAASGGPLFVLLKVRGDIFALPLDQVRAITPVDRITRIPHAPREVRGVADWRGKVLTLYDLGECLALQGHPAPVTYAVVLSAEDWDLGVGILAEEVREIRAIPQTILESLSSSGGPCHGVINLDGLPVMILDLEPLLHHLATAVLPPHVPLTKGSTGGSHQVSEDFSERVAGASSTDG
ncbi:MAG: chemotaxis protein CheW [Candidatus Methylomirabilales bacterium]